MRPHGSPPYPHSERAPIIHIHVCTWARVRVGSVGDDPRSTCAHLRRLSRDNVFSDPVLRIICLLLVVGFHAYDTLRCSCMAHSTYQWSTDTRTCRTCSNWSVSGPSNRNRVAQSAHIISQTSAGAVIAPERARMICLRLSTAHRAYTFSIMEPPLCVIVV